MFLCTMQLHNYGFQSLNIFAKSSILDFCLVSEHTFALLLVVIMKMAADKNLSKFHANSQKNTCVRVSFFNKVAGLKPATLLKKRLWHRCFLVNFEKFLRAPFYRTPLGDCFYFCYLLDINISIIEIPVN